MYTNIERLSGLNYAPSQIVMSIGVLWPENSQLVYTGIVILNIELEVLLYGNLASKNAWHLWQSQII